MQRERADSPEPVLRWSVLTVRWIPQVGLCIGVSTNGDVTLPFCGLGVKECH